MPDNVQKRFLEQLVNGKIDMNTKYLSIYPQWHCRNGGGLFVGIRFQFPVTNYDSEAFASKHTYSCLRLTLGLLVFSINVEVKYNYIKMLPPQ
jgi:hypothetical protein